MRLSTSQLLKAGEFYLGEMRLSELRNGGHVFVYHRAGEVWIVPHRMSNWDIKPIYGFDERDVAQPSVNLTQEPKAIKGARHNFSAIEIPTRLYLCAPDEDKTVPRICCSVDLERQPLHLSKCKIPTFSPRIPLSWCERQMPHVAKKLTLRKLTEGMGVRSW
ncbi:hypothetical protein SPFM15_00025 [Salmonella phage SPFM15]|nr:hypothetical protein SPFM5_00020 [Salmonella phage SPFM5]VFR13353.1 hypothetical protein SPFM14_00018 [Salmonella phage SPFM14]VFR13649.1 hypothetical protein SPFM15_00025 [Salmonella phage SPFM15]